MDRIGDLRASAMTMDEAKALMQEMALASVRIAVHEARANKRIAEIRAALADKTMDDLMKIDVIKAALGGFITANRGEFVKPRTVKTEFGEFGLRTVTELLLKDPDAVVQAVMERGYDECFISVNTPVKDAIRKRLEAGEEIPGAAINSGDTVVCKVNASLVKKELQEVEG